MSTAPQPDEVRIAVVSGHVEVTGLSADDVREAIDMRRAATREQLSARTAFISHVNKAMLARTVPLVSPATQRQAQHRTAVREALLTDQGYETYASLAEIRQTRESSARTWVARERGKGNLFTVKAAGQTLIPSTQLLDGRLNAPVSRMVRTLRAAGMDGWSLWAWLCSPSDLLSGDIPAEIVMKNKARAVKAAERVAASLSPERSRIA